MEDRMEVIDVLKEVKRTISPENLLRVTSTYGFSDGYDPTTGKMCVGARVAFVCGYPYDSLIIVADEEWKSKLSRETQKHLTSVADTLYQKTYPQVNDELGYDAVINLLDESIKELEND
jgi:hypothetical protein